MTNDASQSENSAPVKLDYASSNAVPMRLKRIVWTLILLMPAVGLFVGLAVVGSRMTSVSEAANLARCASKLNYLAKSLEWYISDSNGVFPDSFASLSLSSDFAQSEVICPSDRITRNGDWGNTLQSRAQALSNWTFCSYVYCGDTLKSGGEIDREVVVFYERNANHDNKGMHVVFADGSVELFSLESDRAALYPMIRDAEEGIRPVRLNRP